MNTIKGMGAVTVAVALMIGTALPRGGSSSGEPLLSDLAPGQSAARIVPRQKVVEVAAAVNDADEAVLGRPIALAVDADSLYIADAMDCAIKVFTKDGRYLKSIGQKGPGPGELSFPSGVSVAGDRIVVADKLNFRIQTFDGEGKPRGAFRVPFAPDRIFVLGEDRLLVTANPTGRRPGERLLHIYDTAGRLLWEGLDARASSDPIGDTFRNMILVCPGERGEFTVVYRSGERTIYRFSASGALLAKIDVDERHAFEPVDMVTGSGTLRIAGFCWAASSDRGFLYLSAPEALAGRDLGPGRTVSVIDGQGRLQATVELPCAVHRFLVDEGRIFAVDEEGGLRIFEVRR